VPPTRQFVDAQGGRLGSPERLGRRLALVLLMACPFACGEAASERAGGSAVPGPERAAQLQALGYVDAVVADAHGAASGVVSHDPDRAWPGINVYCSVRSDAVHLLDMSGTELRRVPIPARFDPDAAHAARIEQLPEEGDLRERARRMPALLGADCMAKPDGAGGLLVLSSPYLASVDLDGTARWVESGMHHHDFTRTPEGEILSLAERSGERRFGKHGVPVREHVISVLDGEGRPLREIPLAHLLGAEVAREVDAWAERSWHEARAAGEPVMPLDAYHPNTLEWIERDTGVARRGQLLLCVRNLNRIAIVDLDRSEPVWIWGSGELDWPHDPSLLPNGHVLVFDNGFERGHSRLLEVDPRTNEIVWSWEGTPQKSFFSNVRGAVQPLPNGNLLVTESTRGPGEVVWDFWNPDRLPAGERKQIYRMLRAEPAAWPGLKPH
jgi:hypothetical protein